MECSMQQASLISCSLSERKANRVSQDSAPIVSIATRRPKVAFASTNSRSRLILHETRLACSAPFPVLVRHQLGGASSVIHHRRMTATSLIAHRVINLALGRRQSATIRRIGLESTR